MIAPFILLRTGNDSAAFGFIESAFAIGGLLGGLIVTAWGGFKKRVLGMLAGWAFYAVVGLILFGISRSLLFWIGFAGLSSMTFPFTQSASDSIWQSKVSPDLQGRVFSARRLIAWFMDPIMPIAAGFMADKITEPAMATKSWLSDTFGWLVGTEPGSGIALQFVFAGVLYLVIIAIAFFIPAVRNVETDLPDHDEIQNEEVSIPVE
jgi:DHA3 family macrolide efflux protein-like MFS transporter